MAVRAPSASSGGRALRPAGLPSVRLIANPRASAAGALDAAEVARVLGDDLSVETVLTEGRGHAAELAREAASWGLDVVAVVGGDGTVSEAAGGLAGSATALACLPAGCTDVFARSIGTPRETLTAARRLAAMAAAGRLRLRAIDLGTVNGRPFLTTSGVGFSASMNAVADAAPEPKARLGQLHFARVAVAELAGRYLRRPPRMRAHTTHGVAEGMTVMVQNARTLTYFGPREIRACPQAGLDTGTLSLAVLDRARAHELPSLVARLLTGTVAGHQGVRMLPAVGWAVVEPVDGAPLPVEADGEYLGEHERVEYGVMPSALRVVV